MHFHTKISWLTMLMFLVIIIAMILPSNVSIFLATMLSGALMIYMVFMVLMDEEPVTGDYPIK